MSDYFLWTQTGAAPWIVEEAADRPELANLYYRARELVKSGACERAAVHGRGGDPNRQAAKASR